MHVRMIGSKTIMPNTKRSMSLLSVKLLDEQACTLVRCVNHRPYSTFYWYNLLQPRRRAGKSTEAISTKLDACFGLTI